MEQKTSLNHKNLYENEDFQNIVMPFEDTKILEFDQYHKSDKVSFIIQADLEPLMEKIDGCKNPERSPTTKVGEHISSGFSMSTISSLKSIENKHNVCRSKDYMKNFL